MANDRWVEIAKDGYPDDGIGVLITNGKIVTAARRCTSSAIEDDDIRIYREWSGWQYGGWEWEFDFSNDEITHWMTLPEPPK